MTSYLKIMGFLLIGGIVHGYFGLMKDGFDALSALNLLFDLVLLAWTTWLYQDKRNWSKG